MMGNYYSNDKLLHHADAIREIRARKGVRPIELQLILSDLCNQDCHFCAYRAGDGLSSELFVERFDDGRVSNRNPNRMIEVGKAEEIIRDAAAIGVKSVIFTGGGEPTVHPHHLRLFLLAQGLGMDTALNTNALLLRDGWEGIYQRMTYIRISVDAGTPAEYAEVRGGSPKDYAKVLGHIRQIVGACEPETAVGVGYVVTPGNYHNLVEGVRNLRETGVRYVRLASMQSDKGKAIYDGCEDEVREVIAAAMQEATDSFQVISLFDQALGVEPTYEECHFQKVVTYIGADLNIYRCCYTAYTELGRAASLRDRTLRDWFEDPATHRDHRKFDARRCGICPLDCKNATLNAAVKGAAPQGEPPPHLNFV